MTITQRPAEFFDTAWHHLELERAALNALVTSDLRAAYRLADRRCRISPLPSAQIYLLRAEASYRLGAADAAVADVVKALEINPDDVAATRRLLAWGDRGQKEQAATAIAAHDTDWNSINAAIDLLCNREGAAHCRFNIYDRHVTGWVAWLPENDVSLRLLYGNDAYGVALVPDPDHPLAKNGRCAASFGIVRPNSTSGQVLSVLQGRRIVATTTMSANQASPKSYHSCPHATAAGELTPPSKLTVIVPVFADYAATKACLDSLLLATAGMSAASVLIVDDASPDEKIKHYLSSLASRQNVKVITNSRNLGFVGAINRGLENVTTGDIILLNADTLVPSKALGRLRDVVTSISGAGTATPFSNNGEYTSFPVKNKSNPLPSLERVEVLDRLAAAANDGTVVDLPNGIGFCLYITRSCLDAVGKLSDDFHRGYMEDVDFCLRAAEAGFRNICVPSVFIGHEGSRSFRQEKRSLVVRNLTILVNRYPRYEAESAAFVLADPLQEARTRLEQKILEAFPALVSRMILCGSGIAFDMATDRAQHLISAGETTWVVRFDAEASHLWATISHPANGLPESLRFDVNDGAGFDDFRKLLVRSAPRMFELAGLKSIPPSVLEWVTANDWPCDVLISDADSINNDSPKRSFSPSALHAIDEARRMAVPSADVGNLLTAISPHAPTSGQIAINAQHGTAARKRISSIGIVSISATTKSFESFKEIARRLLAARPNLELVIFGSTFDDLKLMTLPNVYITGAMLPQDMLAAIAMYGVDRLIVGLGDSMPDHPKYRTARRAGLPTVHLNLQTEKVAAEDLWMHPNTLDAAVATAIDHWLGP